MGRIIASPSTRRAAANAGVDLETLAARLGRTAINREDIRPGPQPQLTDHSAWGPVTEEPLSRLARVAAANLTAALAIPSVTHHDSADISRIEDLRATLKAEGKRITALAFHVAVLARCLIEFPRFNASLSEDGARLILKGYVNIGIAIDTPQGLIVPVIRHADRKRVGQIGEELADLAARAVQRRIRPEEMGSASMTISNLGGIGGTAFSPIINPPELAILGLSRTEIRPVWNGSSFEPRPMVSLSLSYDHRVINGADAARFVERGKELIGFPDELLLHEVS